MSDKNTFKVSVICPAFNSENHISDAINSVLSQTHLNLELIVVDGGSRDLTRQIVLGYSRRDSRVRLIENLDDQGPAHARAKGIESASGWYVAFLDADDVWRPRKLEMQLGFMLDQNVDFSFTRYRRMTSDGGSLSCLIPMRNSYNYFQALRGRGIGTLTVMIKGSLLSRDVINVWRRAGGEEYLWWLLILRKGITAFLLDLDLACYRDTAGSLSKNQFYTLRSVWDMYINELKIPLFMAMYDYFLYFIDALVRKIRVTICWNMKRIIGSQK